MPANYVLLATQTVSASAASVTFSNIPQTGYTDLKIVYSARSTVASNLTGFGLAFNGTRTSTLKRLFGNDGTAYADSNVGNGQGEAGFATGASSTASTFGNTEIYIPNYTGSQQKVYSVDTVTEKNSTTGYILGMFAGQNTITAAITSITISDNSGGNIDAGSTFYLYGTAQVGTTPAIAPYASGGDVIANDGTYWYHAFKTTGAFVPAKALSCDVLVVAGGGGGSSGGGGAGGFRTATAQSLLANSYTVTIGAGGAANGYSVQGTNGVASSIGSILASTGGGGGGAGLNSVGNPLRNGLSGGSGGGGGGADPSYGGASAGAGNAGSYSPVEGYAGGAGTAQTYGRGGGGGGGASQVGTAGQFNSPGGVGGNGSTTAISGGSATGLGQLSSGSYYFSGGGAGYNDGFVTAGGIGGGGSGITGVAGTANTGGGGGANGAGGSGIVIIRYAMA